jgi:glycosyltransferase involved in cell wall biosynthesis
MKILLLGEFSNVHWPLACALRRLGHEVTVVSDGDNWKDYPRDVDVRRYSLGLRGTASFVRRLLAILPSLKGYDVVQIINPVFLPVKAERIGFIYNILRSRNKSMFLGAFGMDHFWVHAGCNCTTFRYSDFNLGDTVRHDGDNDTWISEWGTGAKGRLNCRIAENCDGIIAGLYEYYASYQPYFEEKLKFIPFPIDLSTVTPKTAEPHDKVRFFIGIQKQRSQYKGTDIMLRALERVVREFPQKAKMVKVESVPFETYQNLMNSSDVLLDQLYSYTPAMNALLAMAKGLVVVGGGEEENYDILGESQLRPIINVQPNEESVYRALREITLTSDRIPELSWQSAEYIRRHHDSLKVAQQYVDFWTSRIKLRNAARTNSTARGTAAEI